MPKYNNSRKDYDYSKLKLNNLNKKKNWNTHINVKAYNDYNKNFDSSSPVFKWMKVTCLTQSNNCLGDILDKIEDLSANRSGYRTTLKANNVIYNDGLLEFYIKMKKYDIEYITHNVFKIEQYRLKCYKNEEIHIPHEIPLNWIEVIKEVLKGRYSVNPGNNEAELNLSFFSDDKILSDNGLVLNLSSPKVFECVLNILKQELKELTKLNLSNNNLLNIYKLKSFVNSVKIIRLDLSNNRLNSIGDLNCLEDSSIIDLNISDNQFRKINLHDLKKEVRKYIPNLSILNGTKLEESVTIAGDALKSMKKLPEVIKSPSDGDAFNFVLNFFSKFDAKCRDELCDFYSSDSVLTMSTFGESHHFYKSNNSNTLIQKEKRPDSIKRGKAQILGIFANFPTTKHIEESLNVEIIVSDSQFMILVVLGAFIELPSARSSSFRVREFSRTFFIVPGGIVLQEFIQLMPNDHGIYQKYRTVLGNVREQVEFAKSHKDLENLSMSDISIVHQFKTFSGMNVPTCLRFLKAFNGLQPATEEFEKLKANGEVPPEAYQDA